MQKKVWLLLLVLLISISCLIFVACDNSDAGVVYALSEDNTYATVVGYTGNSAEVIIKSKYEGKPVTRIAYGAFRGCDFPTSIVIPESVTTIGDEAFNNCHNLRSIKIPDSVTSIGADALSFCFNLAEIILPDSVTSIGDHAFAWCSSLTNVVIPNSVTHMGFEVFYDCGRLTYHLDGELKYVGNNNNPHLYLIGATTTDITSVSINSNCRFVGSYAFSGCVYLTNIEIPSGVLLVDNGAFWGCNIQSIQLPEGLLAIGDSAFSKCQRLENITIPDKVTTIGYGINGMFYNCYSLQTVILGNGVTTIGESAFDGCNNLTNLVMSGSVTNIGYNAFWGCGKLSRVDYLGTIDQLMQINYANDFANPFGCDLYIDGELVTELHITTEKINDYAFSGWGNLTSVTFDDSVKTIGKGAFANCKGLTSIVIPDGVTTVGEEAFAYCEGLTSIVIPDSVTKMERRVFYSCGNLTIYCKAESEPPIWDVNWNPENCTVIWEYKGEPTD